MIDVSAYLGRIGYEGRIAADHATLQALHLAHATRIPFENLDILLGRPISLDLAHLQAKLLAGRRGGYCFEQNTLFAAVLRALGFSVTGLAARVRPGNGVVLPRTHMCLLVHADGRDWIADVGFGGDGLLMPVALNGQPAQQYLWTYRAIEQSPGLWVMQLARNQTWNDLYAFSLEPQEAADFEMANYYVSTHPQSRFVRSLTVQLPSPERRRILRNRELIVETRNGFETTLVDSDEALLDVLRSTFDLEFPAETVFRCLSEQVQA